MKVDKLSISFDPELGDAVRSAAAQAGKPLSSWLAEAAASKLRAEALAEFLDGWEAEHGVLTAQELARAERELWHGRRRQPRMSALILDAGALVAVDRGDRAMMARLRVAQQHGAPLRSNAVVIAQVWRDRQGRQAVLAQLLRAVDVRAVSPQDGRQAGVLLGLTGTSDPVDATVILLASAGDRILTSDPGDLAPLAEAAAHRAVIIAC